jgi:Protein of unknown function (DUF2842)
MLSFKTKNAIARRLIRRVVLPLASTYKTQMKQRPRKFAGTLLTVAFLIGYSLVAMALGGQFVVGRHGLIEFAYFVFAGIAWLPVVMGIIRWMSKPDSSDVNAAEAVQKGEGNA